MQLKAKESILDGKQWAKGFHHFGVQVFNILRVENRHEGLGAHGLAAVFLSHHQCHVLGVVLEMVDERLALASYGLVVDRWHVSFLKVTVRRNTDTASGDTEAKSG